MFESRIKSLQDALSNHEIDALLITSSYNIAYLSGIHAFSIEEREARILVTKRSIRLFTDARYTEMVKQKAPFIQLVEVSSNNPFSKAFQKATEAENVKEIGFEEESITYKEAADLEEKFNTLEFVPTVDVVEELRTIKDNEESTHVKSACALTDKAYAFILKALVPNVTETEVKAQLENFMRLEGGGISFSAIVAFGSNSAIPHHLSNDTKLKDHDIVLLDLFVK
jgi:Xaa-Pro aminopeptidase